MTAVDFLQYALSIHFTFEQKMQFEGLFQQAKEMEKQQTCDFAEWYYMFGVLTQKTEHSLEIYKKKYNLSQQDKP